VGREAREIDQGPGPSTDGFQMYELRIAVSKVLGTCTSDVPMKRGDYFVVRDGDISIPDGGHICLYAMQNLLPVITPKERALAEAHDEDWVWRVRHVQCPDPSGRVIFTIDQVRKLEKRECHGAGTNAARDAGPLGEGADLAREAHTVDAEQEVDRAEAGSKARAAGDETGSTVEPEDVAARAPCDLRVVVEQVRGTCTSGMKPGDYFLLRGGRLSIPAGRHFCLYALHAALPLLPAKQRRLDAGDWMANDHRVICPDPAGNVVLRIDPIR